MGSRCVFCGRKKGMFQQGTVTFTRRGAQRVARREIVRNAKQATDMSWQEAELVVCDWMKKHGYLDARLTTSGADGGVDVVSRRAVAQVKHHLKPVGIREVQRIYGIGQAERKRPLLFTTAGVSPAALKWANEHGVRCYRFPPFSRLS
jgi:hypothetical protein